jgi:hypothetical protein
MNTKEVLIGVREKLSDPDRWCKHSAGKNSSGRSCAALAPEACSWCLTGAIAAVVRNEDADEMDFARYALMKAIKEVTGCSYAIVEFNDAANRLHSTVMAVLDKSIEIAEKQVT